MEARTGRRGVFVGVVGWRRLVDDVGCSAHESGTLRSALGSSGNEIRLVGNSAASDRSKSETSK
jgi:hypothetical protein